MSQSTGQSEVWGIVSPWETKRAALMFDRIYRWPRHKDGLLSGTMIEELNDIVENYAIVPTAGKDWRPPDEMAFGTVDDDAIFHKVWHHLEMQYFKKIGGGDFQPDPAVFANATLEVARRYSSGSKKILLSCSSVDRQKFCPDRISLANRFEAVLTQIPVAQPDGLEWNHIVEFRKDKSSVRKYRDLRMWVTNGLQAKTPGEAQDLIARRVDDYRLALKTWGIKTAVGSIKQILELKKVAPGAVASATALMLNGPVLAALVAGVSVLAHAAIYCGESYIELDRVRMENRDVAYLVDIEKLVAKRGWFSSLWKGRAT